MLWLSCCDRRELMYGSQWLSRRRTFLAAIKADSGMEFCYGGSIRNSKGRPRKPLAEVILWGAPLRATSSVFVRAHNMPSASPSKQASSAVLPGRNCSQAGNFYPGDDTQETGRRRVEIFQSGKFSC